MAVPAHLLITEENIDRVSALLDVLQFIGETADDNDISRLQPSLLSLVVQAQQQIGQARRGIKGLYSYNWPVNSNKKCR